jgi:hypothetical protein
LPTTSARRICSIPKELLSICRRRPDFPRDSTFTRNPTKDTPMLQGQYVLMSSFISTKGVFCEQTNSSVTDAQDALLFHNLFTTCFKPEHLQALF